MGKRIICSLHSLKAGCCDDGLTYQKHLFNGSREQSQWLLTRTYLSSPGWFVSQLPVITLLRFLPCSTWDTWVGICEGESAWCHFVFVYLQKSKWIRTGWKDRSQLPPGNFEYLGAVNCKVATREKQKVLKRSLLPIWSMTNDPFSQRCLFSLGYWDCSPFLKHFSSWVTNPQSADPAKLIRHRDRCACSLSPVYFTETCMSTFCLLDLLIDSVHRK